MISLPDDPQSTSSASPEDRFDDALRRRLTDFEVDPTPTAWPTLSAQLPAPRAGTPTAAAWRTQLGSFASGMLTGALLWWGGNRLLSSEPPFAGATLPARYAVTTDAPPTVSATPAVSATTTDPALSPGETKMPLGTTTASTSVTEGALDGVTTATTPATSAAPSASPVAGQRSVAGYLPTTTGRRLTPLKRHDSAPKNSPTSKRPYFAGPVAAPRIGTPETDRQELPVENKRLSRSAAAITAFVRLSGVETRDSIIRQRARAYMKPATLTPDTLRTARLRVLVAEQTRDLSMLQARLDSVKRFLPDASAAPTKPAASPKTGR